MALSDMEGRLVYSEEKAGMASEEQAFTSARPHHGRGWSLDTESEEVCTL